MAATEIQGSWVRQFTLDMIESFVMHLQVLHIPLKTILTNNLHMIVVFWVFTNKPNLGFLMYMVSSNLDPPRWPGRLGSESADKHHKTNQGLFFLPWTRKSNLID